jgi:transposase
MPTHKSEDYKLSAVEYYLTEDKTQEEVCKIFKCSARSLLRWVDKYNENGKIKRHNRKPVAYKVHKDQVKFILDEIKKNKTITMQDLLEKLKEKYPTLSLSRFHLNRIVNDNNITLKITRIRHEPNKRFGKDIDINKKIKEFYNEVKKYKIKDIICIDETSIKSLQKRHHCYSDIGKRCVIKTQSQEVFKKYTGIFAISTKGVLGWELYENSGINTDRLIEFLEKYITTKFKDKLIILDNASSHRNERIKELVNKHNNILLLFKFNSCKLVKYCILFDIKFILLQLKFNSCKFIKYCISTGIIFIFFLLKSNIIESKLSILIYYIIFIII